MAKNSSTREAKLADAGVLIAAGKSAKQALMAVGYSESTARAPKRNNIDANQCLEHARTAGKLEDPTKLVQGARRALSRKLDSWNNSDAELKKARGGEIARVVDVAERWYGTSEPDDAGDRRLDRRLELFSQAILEAQRRGLIQDSSAPTATIEATPVAEPGAEPG